MKRPVALLIIDMQKGMQSPQLPARNNVDAEGRIAELLAACREGLARVVHVRHVSRTVGSVFWPGQPGVEFQTIFAPLADEYVVEKNVPDAFVNTGLEKWLHQRDIKALLVVGVSTNNSVEASARSAGNLGFETYVASDACFTFEKHDFNGQLRSAEEVHAMSLANLQGEYAKVMTTSQLLEWIRK